MARVLCVSFDETVSHGRVELLVRLGYDVVATIHPQEAVRLLAAQKFDAVVLGHRFPKTERHHLAEMSLRKRTPVVLVCGASTDADIPAAARVYALEGDAGLRTALLSLLPVATLA